MTTNGDESPEEKKRGPGYGAHQGVAEIQCPAAEGQARGASYEYVTEKLLIY